ncbi:hypothetical protein TFLX_00973 [Thermoflexales bacterium]|nr:hypothetical protein TFLX_00973 [Thermoflexales bacterium]
MAKKAISQLARSGRRATTQKPGSENEPGFLPHDSSGLNGKKKPGFSALNAQFHLESLARKPGF